MSPSPSAYLSISEARPNERKVNVFRFLLNGI
jgi:hypothetical protein